MRETEGWAGNHRIPSLLLPGAAAPREGFHQSRDYRGNSVRLYFLRSKITADGDCSHEIKRCLLPGRKVTTNLDSILKSRDITLTT